MLAPGVLPPIFKSSGPAIDNLPEPADTAAYVRQAVELATLPHQSETDGGHVVGKGGSISPRRLGATTRQYAPPRSPSGLMYRMARLRRSHLLKQSC